ncbi:class I SAM-dependent methyltransferase [Dolichospermum sp. UHCC 0259]|uniref:class I SAM-dependent methyltransferase n=1 Tax=Dolichospermum sp. UHCC 0259 TaxID=2590010 RepID=UPI001445334A|nr:class I SAM-dependent methyltransferase [Dolichospermum sp. UHCC 0259]MTJ50318.1 class I SAM-dependent methyltransferase [Dolichospermum sp. UHCC 0259]
MSFISKNSMKNSWYEDYLMCPDCGCNLNIEDKISCTSCKFSSDLTNLKPQNPQNSIISVKRIDSGIVKNIIDNVDISRPILTYDGPKGLRDSSELLTEITKYLKLRGNILDLGCGPRDQFICFDYLGHNYVGIDYSNISADFLADAHSIPFKSASFDCVISYAVLEHLYNPFLAINEIERVLHPNGIFVGTVSQGEPFHSSFFHHTAWGLISLVQSTQSLKVTHLWNSADTLTALSEMGSYNKFTKSLLRLASYVELKLPFLTPRKMFTWSEKEKQIDRLNSSGSICFVIQKTSSNQQEF